MKNFRKINPIYVLLGLLILFFIILEFFNSSPIVYLIFISVSITLAIIVLGRALITNKIVAWGGWDIDKSSNRKFAYWGTFVGYILLLIILVYVFVIIFQSI